MSALVYLDNIERPLWWGRTLGQGAPADDPLFD